MMTESINLNPVQHTRGNKRMRRLTYTEGSSNKFWEISRNGNRVNVRWGRMGSEGQSKVLGFDSDAEAEAAHAKMLNEKLKKGYVDEGSAPPNVKTRQIDPRVVQRMDTVCTGIETFFERIRAEEKMNLVSSAIRRLSHAEIEAWEKKNKLKLPDEVFAFFLRGLSFGECFFDNSAGHVNIGFDFLDLNAVTKERKLLKSVTKNGGFDDPDEFELDFEQEQHLELLNKGIPMTRNEPQLVLHEGSIYHYSVRNDVKALDLSLTEFLEVWLASGCFSAGSPAAARKFVSELKGTNPSNNRWLEYYENTFGA